MMLFNLIMIELRAQPGALDISFGNNGIITTKIGSEFDGISSIVIQPDQKILAGGYSFNGDNFDFALARYDTNGDLDQDFGLNGIVITAFGSGDDAGLSVVLQSEGKIVVSGYTDNGINNDFASVRYNTNGSIDSTFGTDGKVVTNFYSLSILYSTVVDESDRIIAVGGTGDSSISPSFHVFAICRYSKDGSLDSTFGDEGKVLTVLGNDAFAKAAALQQDGKIIVCGPSYFGYNPTFSIVRYMNDGSLDDSFGDEGKVFTSIGYSSSPSSLAIQQDNKIIVAGNSFDGFSEKVTLVRYNSDGTLDQAFDSNGIVLTSFGSEDYSTSSVCLLTENKILVAGDVKDASMNSKMALVRYHSNGSLDSTFGTNGLVITHVNKHIDRARSMAIQADNRIVVGGFTSLNNSPPPFISAFVVARYMSDWNPGIIEPKITKIPFHIYPNPVISELHFELKNNYNGIQLEVLDLFGRKHLEYSLIPNQLESCMDLSTLHRGFYLLLVKEGYFIHGASEFIIE